MFFFRIVSFADYVEELGHPYMWVQNLGGLHYPSDVSEVCVEMEYYASIVKVPLCYLRIILLCLHVVPGCACWEFSQCQPHGDHHEAAQGSSPVPLGFT